MKTDTLIFTGVFLLINIASMASERYSSCRSTP